MKLWKGVAILAFAMSLSGCAFFKGDNIPETTLAPPEQAEAMRPSVHYDVNATQIMSVGASHGEKFQQLVDQELAKILKESNYFSAVVKDGRDADINLSVTFTDTTGPGVMIGGIISGLTLWTIPTWLTECYELKAVVKTKNNQTKAYEMSDSFTMVSWLPMILLAPVKNITTITDVRENMYRNLFMHMKDDGLLIKKGPDGH